MLTKLRNFLADRPVIFTMLRKIIELNFYKQKRFIKENFSLDPSEKVLDIGSGTGEFADSFKKADYFGIDISPIYVNYAKKKNKGKFEVMDATRLQFSDNSFDYILIMAILHHLSDEDIEKVLLEAKRVLVPGGRILIMEDAKVKNLENFLVRFFQKFDKGEFIREPKEYDRLISKSFEIIKTEAFRSGTITYYSLLVK